MGTKVVVAAMNGRIKLFLILMFVLITHYSLGLRLWFFVR